MSSRNSNTSPDRRPGKLALLIWAVAAGVLAYLAAPARALDPNRLLGQYSREVWGSEKGFPGGTITAIGQTPGGYLWIGTDKGLVRFDGISFQTFPRAVPGTFSIGAVRAMTSDGQGNLWILLQSTNILRYRDGKFEPGQREGEFGITAAYRSVDGRVIFSSLVYGELKYGEGKFEVLPGLESEAAETATGGGAAGTDQQNTRLSWAPGVAAHHIAEPDSAVIAMAETSDGKLWLGTRDRGLFYALKGKVTPVETRGFSEKITSLITVGNNRLWIGTDKGVSEWNGTTLTQAEIPEKLRGVGVLAMIRDTDSVVWVGTTEGLFRVVGDKAELDEGAGANPGGVTALFEDREGNLWVGTSRGLERLRDSAFISYTVAGVQSPSGGPIHVDRDGRTWFAPIEGGLRWLEGEKSGSVTKDGLSQDVVYSIAGDGGDLWIGRQQGGLTKLRFNGGAIATKTYTSADGLAQNGVYAVLLSRDGAVWAATLNGGVSVLKDGRFTTYTRADGLASNTVIAMAESADGTKWFGTPNGLASFANGRWRNYSTQDGLPSNTVDSLLMDSKGVLWIGTASGLCYLQSGAIGTPGGALPVLQEDVLGMGEDKDGRLWVSTANHVLAVSREKLLEAGLSAGDIREYGPEDGLAGTEGVKRFPSVYADAQGRVWFSMNRGLSVVDTNRTVDDSVPAVVHIVGISADGNPVDTEGRVRIPAGSRRVAISFAGLSLSVPDRVRYRYKMEGFDKDWSEPAATREAVYTNLGAGAYRFHVMASNSDGLWNSGETTLPVEIKPLVWETWWFRLASVLAVGLVIVAVLRLRVLQLTRQLNVRFEERLAERTRIAQELHDTLLQGFLSASMQLHVANDQLPSDSPAKPMVGRVLGLMGRVIEEGRHAVQGLRQSKGASADLEQAFSRIREEFPVKSEIEFRLIVDGPPRPLRPLIRDEVYLIGHEALSNAFRHSRASEVELELEYGASDLRVLVRDNGGGIDPQVVRSGRVGHWGLSVMRERAKKIGGTLRVLSSATAGTEIELSVPSQIAFESKSQSAGRNWISKLSFGKRNGGGSEEER